MNKMYVEWLHCKPTKRKDGSVKDRHCYKIHNPSLEIMQDIRNEELTACIITDKGDVLFFSDIMYPDGLEYCKSHKGNWYVVDKELRKLRALQDAYGNLMGDVLKEKAQAIILNKNKQEEPEPQEEPEDEEDL